MNVPDSDSEDELPPGWEERVTVDGNVFYANHLTKATQWTHPRTGIKKVVNGELPFGWERCVDKNTGKVIYVDHENKRTTYTDPRLAFAIEEKDHVNDYRQRFDASSTALQVLHGRDLNNKLCIITGGNCGIGLEAAKSLCRHGCHVIIAVRNMEAGESALEEIKSAKADAKCDIVQLDLASLTSVLNCAEEIQRRLSSQNGGDIVKNIDILILNAGVFGLGYEKSDDGYEKTFAVNHLGHFYLTLLLRPLFKVGSRVVVLSSESHRFANLTPDTLNPATLSVEPSQYWHMTAYNNSKLCNVLFARQLAKNLQDKGISVFSLHPGNMVSSGLARNWWVYRLAFFLVRPFTKSMQQAASTTVFCATAAELQGTTGVYFNNCYRCQESQAAQSDVMAVKLWKISVKMIENALGSSRAKGLNNVELINEKVAEDFDINEASSPTDFNIFSK